MMRGLLGFSLIAMLAIVALATASFAATTPCSDGTAYYACSTKSPGYRCMPNAATGTNTLQVVLVDVPASIKCACEKVAGYIEKDGACVKSTCTSGGQTVQADKCLNNQKCVNGEMVDDAVACGCPLGKKAQNNICVEKKEGCRWTGSIKCPSYQECKFDATSAVDDGTCMTKSGCQYAQQNGQACDIDIETCNQQTGKCDRKPGTCKVNADCTGGKVCNVIAKMCEEPATTGADAAQILGGGATAGAAAADGQSASKPTICCLPVSVGMVGVGLAFASRRRK